MYTTVRHPQNTVNTLLDAKSCRIICRTYKLCLTPGMSVCSKSFSVEKYQPISLKEGPKKTNSSDLLSFTISYRTTPKYYSGDHREKIKLFYQELDREGEGLDGAEMHEELERRRRTEIMRRILETFLIILVTVSSILCICLLCLLKFC